MRSFSLQLFQESTSCAHLFHLFKVIFPVCFGKQEEQKEQQEKEVEEEEEEEEEEAPCRLKIIY